MAGRSVAERVLDANIILRFLLADHATQSPRCRDLFARLEAGEEHVYLPEIVLADVVWTLTSFYRWPRAQTQAFLAQLFANRGVRTAKRRRAELALALFVEKHIDFSDALVAAEMSLDGRREIYSYDRDFDRIAEITRVTPGTSPPVGGAAGPHVL